MAETVDAVMKRKLRDRYESRRYGAAHQRLRRQLVPIVAAGRAFCARCGEAITVGEAWDLGHDDVDRARYSGPEHARCNRAAPNKLHPSRAW